MLDPDLVEKSVKQLLAKRKSWEEGKTHVGCSLSEFETHMETNANIYLRIVFLYLKWLLLGI